MSVKVTRRTFVRGAGVTIGASAVGVGSTGLDRGPVEEAEAIAPIILYGAAAFGGSVALGWSLRHFETIGSDPPPEGLTAEVLKEETYKTARTRQSTNQSTFVDNQNILDGMKHAVYTDAKLAAIDALNNEQSQADVETAATDAIDEYESTIRANLIRSWNEARNELYTMIQSARDHPDTSETGYIKADLEGANASNYVWQDASTTYELPNGEVMDVQRVKFDGSLSDDMSGVEDNIHWSLKNYKTSANLGDYPPYVKITSGDGLSYMRASDWTNLWQEMNTRFSDVRDGILLWVDSVYGDVQAGDLNLSDLMTPREQAEILADEEDYPQAVADLLALNIPVDFEREATIDIPDQGVTIRGTLGLTNPPDTPLTTGETYSPGTFGTTYITYDISTGEGTWSAYEEGIDGGVVTFTSEPHPETLYEIDTSAGETVDATTGEFTEGDDGSGNTEWTVDLSGELDTAITSIETVRFYSEVEETQYETVQLEDDFIITSIENSDGEQVNEMEFTQDEPQDDTNYITTEEWERMEERNEELIEKYEEAANGSGPTGGLFPNGIVAWATNNPAKAVAGGGGIAAAWAILTA